MTTKSADYCVLINEWVWLSLLHNAGSRPGFSFGVKPWTEMEIWCIEGMFMLKLVLSEKNSGFEGIIITY